MIDFSIDGYLKTNLDTAKKVIKKDWDMVFLYDGYEGSGKSVKAQQDAFYCDPSFCIERIAFTPKEFRDAIQIAEPYQAVVYDEAYTGLSSRATMTNVNRALVQMLAEIRQKNLFVFVVMPTFFDLDKYVALWRSRALIHVYTKDFQRGFFAFYNIDLKKSLYINGKKFYSYAKPRPNFIGRFTNHYVVDEKEYRNKKRNSLVNREQKNIQAEQEKELQDLLFERIMVLDEKHPHTIRMEILGLPQSTYFYKLKQWKEKQDN